MQAFGLPGVPYTANQTLRPGAKPGLKMEKTTMILKHPSMTFDLVAISSKEKLDQSIRAAMVAEARRGGTPKPGIVRSIRRAFGAAVIGIGHRIHGDRRAGAESPVLPAANTMGLAR